MRTVTEKLSLLAERLRAGGEIRVAIFGLGSVGHYLLEYLLALDDPRLRIQVVGRNRERLLRAANISRIAGLIRGNPGGTIRLEEADFSSVDCLSAALARLQPDIVVNASRAYSGLKYGSISWQKVRAYGLWAPLSVKYIRNLMLAQAGCGADAVVINTSYADATNAWLRSAGLSYPEFGSGNLNHLVPRIRLAVAAQLGLDDAAALREIDVTLATSHFHDVVISKEGTTEGVDPLLAIRYRGRPVPFDATALFRQCALEMPVDQRRNMMNASSNFEIIRKLLLVAGADGTQKLHIPGFEGMIGGYPVELRAAGSACTCRLCETPFGREAMVAHNRRSIYLDGIADVRDGTLHYTPELRAKVQQCFGCELPGTVSLAESDAVAELLVEQIIARQP